MRVSLEVEHLHKLSKDVLFASGTVIVCPFVDDVEEGEEGQQSSVAVGSQLQILFDRRGYFKDAAASLTLPQLKAALKLPRGKDSQAGIRASGEAYVRFVTVEYGFQEPELNARGAVVVHASKVIRLLVEPEDNSHSELDKAEKGDRHRIFCDWVVETFGAEYLSQGTGVVDVAGGRGLVSQSFAAHAIRSTCIEPVPREMDRDNAPTFETLSAFFDEDLLSDPIHRSLFEGASCFVGMHPDQATELLVANAVAQEKPFACVPCCVFRKLFPHRRLSTGQGVMTYRGLIRYLAEMHPNIRQTTLPFDGCNTVLWMGHEDFDCVARVCAEPN